MLKIVEKTRDVVLDILFPPLCAGCAKPYPESKLFYFCNACRQGFHRYTTLFCATCHRRLPDNKKVCHKDARYLLGAATDFGDPLVRRLLHEMKFGKHGWAADALGELLISYMQSLEFDFSNFVVVPVPLHPSRERERGFNQAKLLGVAVSRALTLPIFCNFLRRTRATLPHAELKNYEMREGNIAGAFSVPQPAMLVGKNIILVDDVFTSGATMREVVATLKIAGVRKIVGVVVARAG